MNTIVSQFNIQGNVVEVAPLGNGLINTTYRVKTEGTAPDYVLQHVNNAIFPDVDMLMNNIVAVTEHIHGKLVAAGADDIERKVLKFVPAKDGKYYHFDGEKYWRVMEFIPDTVGMTAVTPETSYIVGETFGNFQAMLADIPAELGETIKDFHNMEFRLRQLREAVAENKAGRLAEVQWLVDELEARAEEMCKGERLHREGKLAKRICHCDTKVDNILWQSINFTLEKQITRKFKLNFLYSFQEYNDSHGVNNYTWKSNIFVADMLYKWTPTISSRLELQYLYSKSDQKDWMAALAEVNFAPNWSIFASDMYNHGKTNIHYYNAGVSYTKSRTRVQLSYGRNRAGVVCSGGVCRNIPAYTGANLMITTSF